LFVRFVHIGGIVDPPSLFRLSFRKTRTYFMIHLYNFLSKYMKLESRPTARKDN